MGGGRGLKKTLSIRVSWGFPAGSVVKNLPAMQETWIPSLGWEDPLEEGMATHSSILAWRIPRDRGAWWATVHGVAKSWTRLSLSTHTHTHPSHHHDVLIKLLSLTALCFSYQDPT